ncbi:hypothetical protein PRIPAC_93815 [Pristionchus pacificus]|uniref:Uncharacterized protein n=1 Tax=Pristionchus pacificus TaxID=54126 RepID=A0A2A6CI37_PRIPA|nr:hypothetical protein PRIPAC_93815 [Pristionchus pacificus]|eukprot:PDM77894.1 hypothetical protein PRIPAC_34761 [Pristionchus pacificus]
MRRMRLLFIIVALLGVASASSNCPWKWCKDGKREAESADAPKPPELPPWRGKKSYPEDPSGSTTFKPASENGPSFMAPFKKRETEEIAGAPKPAPPVGPPFMGKRETEEELEIPCSEQDPKLPGCRKFKRTAADSAGAPKEPELPPWRGKREDEELENPTLE